MGILRLLVATNLLLFFSSESVACSESAVTINLEEEVPFTGAEFRGPLFGVRRDHQDGLGTCYANTARNIIVGLTNGATTPSFLDLALQYKRDSSTLNQNVLDGGDSCQTIRSVQVPGVGICDQANSPLETGDRSAASELLFLSDSSLGAQGAMLANLREFFQSVT